LTKQEHIAYWVEAANKDWMAVQDMYAAKTFVYSLFFAHLVLEKLAKANWVKDNEENFPPKTHNLLSIISKTSLQFSIPEEDFFARMNQFQLEGRYPDYKFALHKKFDAVETKNILDKVNELRICLLRNL
jgi:HEPN domain-containing protein